MINTREINVLKKMYLSMNIGIPLDNMMRPHDYDTVSFIWYDYLVKNNLFNSELMDPIFWSVLDAPRKDFAYHNDPTIPEDVKMRLSPDYRRYVTEFPVLIERLKVEYEQGVLNKDNLPPGVILTDADKGLYEKWVLANVLYEMSRDPRGKPRYLFIDDGLVLTKAESSCISFTWKMNFGGWIIKHQGFSGVWNLICRICGLTCTYEEFANYVVQKHKNVYDAKIESGRRMGFFR